MMIYNEKTKEKLVYNTGNQNKEINQLKIGTIQGSYEYIIY